MKESPGSMAQLNLLYRVHLQELLAACARWMPELGVSVLIIGSGRALNYFEDDQSVPFRTNANFAYFCALEGPGHFLRIEPGKRPKIARLKPDDFWHAKPSEFDASDENWAWAHEFDFEEYSSADQCFQSLGHFPARTVFLGDQSEFAIAAGLDVNPFLVVSRLNWLRSYKSDYEIECLRIANCQSALGHSAAAQTFYNGGSEFEIYCAYLSASQVTESALPYGAIVALDSHAAVLHYEKKDHARNGNVLLIDAGLKFKNYGSDITRTYQRVGADKEGAKSAVAAELFAELVREVHFIQGRLCQRVQPGVSFYDLHSQMHLEVAKLLLKTGIVKAPISEDVALDLVLAEVTHHFIPHGIGHLLGLFVHDVAGHAGSPFGEPIVGVPQAKYLRSYRKLEDRMVLTIEPGFYLIPKLLSALREKTSAPGALNLNLDWKLIENLVPFGGIRVEDNVVVRAAQGNGGAGSENLTRLFVSYS